MRRRRYWIIMDEAFTAYYTRPTIRTAHRLAVKLSSELGTVVFYHTNRAVGKARRLRKKIINGYSVDVRRKR